MPEPDSKQHWVCSTKCLTLYDAKCEQVVGRNSLEFLSCCGRVVPPY
jgi:hypothetical protein